MTGTASLDAPRPISAAPRREPPAPSLVYPLAAAGVILAVAVLNALYLVFDCPLELAADEAHYWDWSRHLDWCYYSKGPLVAWLIRGSRELFGDLSATAVGSEMLAVRLPAVACHALLLAAIYTLSSRALRSPKLGFLCVLVAVTLPPVAALGVVMTIDPPFLACWAWACVLVHSAVLRGGGVGIWAMAGAVVAVGVLAKYTMLLFPACVAAYLWVTPGRRIEFRRAGFWVMSGFAALALLPIIVWNAGNDWVGFRHLFALAAGPGIGPKPVLAPLGLLGYLIGQWGLFVGFWFQAVAIAAWVYRPKPNPPTPFPKREGGARRSPSLLRGGVGEGFQNAAFLWWLCVPLWLFFAAASVRTSGKVNWPAPAYITGLVLAVGWIADSWHRPVLRKWLIGGIVAASAAGLFLTFCAHYPGPMRSVLATVVRPASPDEPVPIRKLDPTCRLAGWRTLASEIDRLRERVTREDGQEPILAGMVWTTPGELGFYCRGNPQAYSVGVAVADRHSQYDIWRPNPVFDAQAFRERTFLYVGERIPEMERVFDRIEPPVEVIASDGGIPVAAWKVWVCRGYRGFPNDGGRRLGRGY